MNDPTPRTDDGEPIDPLADSMRDAAQQLGETLDYGDDR